MLPLLRRQAVRQEVLPPPGKPRGQEACLQVLQVSNSLFCQGTLSRDPIKNPQQNFYYPNLTYKFFALFFFLYNFIFVFEMFRKGYSYKHLLEDHVWKEHGEGQHVR